MEEQELEKKAARLEKYRAARKRADAAWKERQRKEKKERTEKARVLISRMKEKGYWEGLDVELREFVERLAQPAAPVAGSTFAKMFGPGAEVGSRVTLKDAFARTMKGKSSLDASMRKWAKRGVVVQFEPKGDSVLDGEYVIVRM